MQTGQQIDNYVIQRPLGSGGMADVYLAWDRGNQWPVALKLMNASAMSNPRLQERFKREVATAARLRHPHLVQVYNWGQASDGRYYLVMEYIDGGSLAALIHRQIAAGRTVPDAQAAYLIRRVAGAMAYAHAEGVVHRDLKPANILLRSDTGEPVVTDLGIAAVSGANPLTGTMETLGTPHYMAPEQASGSSPTDERSDVYAMGVMLCEMVSGYLPFDGETGWAILAQKMHNEPPPLTRLRPGANEALAGIVAACLQRDPAQRYASAAALAVALDSVIPTGAIPPIPPPPAGRGTTEPIQGNGGERKPISPLMIGAGILGILFLMLALYSILDRPTPAVTSITPATQLASTLSDESGSDVIMTPQVSEDVEVPPASGGANGLSSEKGNNDSEQVAVLELTPSPTPIIPTATQEAVANVPTNEPTATRTPKPTDIPTLEPTKTPEPLPTDTPQPAACTSEPLGDFRTSWDRDRLGCALNGGRSGVWMATENFEGGIMLWREDTDKIYAIFNSGGWARFDDTWREGDPEFTCGEANSPPTPKRGFGKVWCTHDGVRNGLGNARDGESGANGAAQDFERGTIIRVPTGRIYVLYGNDSTWR